MDKKTVKTGKSPESKNAPLKPVRKKRRIFLWLFLSFFLLGGLVGAAFFYRLIPMSDETAATVEPYLVKAEEIARSTGESLSSLDPYFEKLKFWKSPEAEVTAGNPKTNFPLVELNENSKQPAPATGPAASSTILELRPWRRRPLHSQLPRRTSLRRYRRLLRITQKFTPDWQNYMAR